MADRNPVPYPNFGGTVWNSYANQPAAQIVRVSSTQSQFGVTGSGIVADLDTGVDPTHPALQSVLLPGYDFTQSTRWFGINRHFFFFVPLQFLSASTLPGLLLCASQSIYSCGTGSI